LDDLEALSDMSAKHPWGTEAPAKVGRGFTTAITGFLGVGAIAALYVMGLAACKPPPDDSLATLAHGAMAKLQIPAVSSTYPAATFVDGTGSPVTLSDFKGKAVVLNLWATWCAPCVKEMPTLAALQTAEAGKGVKVVALSADSPSATDKAKAFIASHPPLDFYQDDKLAMPSAITPHIEGFPTTLLYDPEGRLRGVMEGDADWSSPEARAVVAKLATI
jgi:thiol-disulfide isomerase/thioredoxin